jgi:SAM-dependent methyltransferase
MPRGGIPLRTRVATRLARARRRLRDATYGQPDQLTVREDLARRYLRGAGLEIGALNRPLRVPPAASVRYVDRVAAAELKARYPEYAHQWIVDPEVIDDAETLATVADSSVDFVIANHVIEHLENPLGALSSWMRVLRPDGVVYLAIPDKRRTFDAERESTSLEHLLRDANEGPQWSRTGHYEEWTRLVEPHEDAAVLERQGKDIHFHVWALADLLWLLAALPEEHGFPFDLDVVQANGNEILAVLRRI